VQKKQTMTQRTVNIPEDAFAIEKAIKHGEWEYGRPLLNPGT
jgi:hypothetical protein